jgi:hypothetical protein
MVIAERADPFIKQWDRTNPDGYLVTQYGGASAPIPLSGGASAPTPLSGEEAAPAASSDAPEASSDPAAPVASSE